jgi:Ca2+-transporting ATPase
VYDPAWYPSNSFSSALQIPYPKTHVRSNSAGTNATERSGWSGWSPSSPGSSGRISDFGDDEDLRQLLKSIGDSEDTIAENPFAFTKLQLGKNLYDSKDLNVLRAVKGLEGLTMGLRTDVENGVPLNEDRLEGQVTIEDIWQDFESPQRERFQEGHASVNQMSDDTPGLRTVTSVNVKERFSYGFLRRPKPQSRREFFTDRSRVFGDNRIPQRPAKNMLQLMWIAFQDKVIVDPYILRAKMCLDPS